MSEDKVCCPSAKKIKDKIAEQAEDEGLWFITRTAPEAYLQRELRMLHEIIEQEFGPTRERE